MVPTDSVIALAAIAEVIGLDLVLRWDGDFASGSLRIEDGNAIVAVVAGSKTGDEWETAWQETSKHYGTVESFATFYRNHHIDERGELIDVAAVELADPAMFTKLTSIFASYGQRKT